MEQEGPLNHCQMDQMRKLVRNFCSTFIKPDKIKVLLLDVVTNSSNHISYAFLFDGNEYKSSLDQDTLSNLGKLVIPSLINTATHLINKLPFSNIFLKSFLGLDPKYCKEKTVDKLKMLNNSITVVNLNKSNVESEIRKHCCSIDQPPFENVPIN